MLSYFSLPKKTIPDGDTEFVDCKQARVNGQPGNEMLKVNGFDDYSPRVNNTETYIKVRSNDIVIRR